MKQSVGKWWWAWYGVGVGFITLGVLSLIFFILLLALEEGEEVTLGLFGLLGSVFAGAIGIYGVRRGGKARDRGIAAMPARVETNQLEPDSLTPVTSKDEGADNLCAHFLALGIEAKRLHKHPLEKAGIWGILTRERRGKLVRVVGKNIGYVDVYKLEDLGTQYSSGAKAWFCDYLVPLRERSSRLCRAKLGKKNRSFWSTEIVDIEWKGETLADMLNGDLTLEQRLLEEFQLNRPLEIKITPWPAYQCAKLKTRAAGTGFHFPSCNMFDCLDRIAGHVVKVASASSPKS